MAKATCTICNKTFKNEEGLEMHTKAIHAPPVTAKPKTKKKTKSMVVWAIILIVVVGFIAVSFSQQGAAGEYDEFAQCLTDSGAKMYGAYWCPHCEGQRAEFGRSEKYIPYIECSLPNRAGQTAECAGAGIQSYPTWEFADGSRLTGAQAFETLSQRTGCQLPLLQ